MSGAISVIRSFFTNSVKLNPSSKVVPFAIAPTARLLVTSS
jgi:hypothetical protein